MDEIRCITHPGKYLEFLCSTCNEIVCVKCTTSIHRGHLIDDLESIAQNNQQYTERMQYLWKLMNRCTVMIESFNRTEQNIVQHYRDIHNLLMVEELKIKKPILTEREKAESLLATILEELKSLNKIIKGSDVNNNNNSNSNSMISSTSTSSTSSPIINNNNNNITFNSNLEKIDKQEMDDEIERGLIGEEEEIDEDEDEDEDEEYNKLFNSSIIIESIRDSSSIDEFMTSRIMNNNSNNSGISSSKINSVMSNINSNSGMNSSCSGISDSGSGGEFSLETLKLLRRIQQYTNSFQSNSYNEPIYYDIRFDDDKFEIAKSTLNSMYEIVDLDNDQPEVSTCHHIINSILTVGENGIHFLDVQKMEWYQNDSEDREERILPFNSLVSTKDYVYVFGGSSTSTTYSRYSIRLNQWDFYAQIQTKVGGCGISTCFDGDHTIYLVGGATKTGRVSRIDAFDTETMEFQTVGAMDMCRSESLSFYLNGIVYIVGGCDLAGKETKSMLAFDTHSGECSTYIEHMGFKDRIISSCFDGVDRIYILDKERNFFSVSLATKGKEILKSPSINNSSNKHSMVYCPKKFKQTSAEIIFIGGKTHQNHQYNVDKNQWRIIDQTDTTYRSFDAAIGYYDPAKLNLPVAKTNQI